MSPNQLTLFKTWLTSKFAEFPDFTFPIPRQQSVDGDYFRVDVVDTKKINNFFMQEFLVSIVYKIRNKDKDFFRDATWKILSKIIDYNLILNPGDPVEDQEELYFLEYDSHSILMMSDSSDFKCQIVLRGICDNKYSEFNSTY